MWWGGGGVDFPPVTNPYGGAQESFFSLAESIPGFLNCLQIRALLSTFLFIRDVPKRFCVCMTQRNKAQLGDTLGFLTIFFKYQKWSHISTHLLNLHVYIAANWAKKAMLKSVI
jgi:hypothetical protein